MIVQRSIYGITFIIATILLVGCVNMASTGAQVVYNRHSLKKNINDQYVSMQAYQALYFNTEEFKNTHIAITTYNGDMLLAGQVATELQKSRAYQLASQVEGHKKVYNFLTVEGPTSTLTKMSDGWITTKVKARLITSEEVDATKIKVVTEKGMVYLMGILLPEEAKAAVELARTTSGVQGVVKIFSYLHIDKHPDKFVT